MSLYDPAYQAELGMEKLERPQTELIATMAGNAPGQSSDKCGRAGVASRDVNDRVGKEYPTNRQRFELIEKVRGACQHLGRCLQAASGRGFGHPQPARRQQSEEGRCESHAALVEVANDSGRDTDTTNPDDWPLVQGQIERVEEPGHFSLRTGRNWLSKSNGTGRCGCVSSIRDWAGRLIGRVAPGCGGTNRWKHQVTQTDDECRDAEKMQVVQLGNSRRGGGKHAEGASTVEPEYNKFDKKGLRKSKKERGDDGCRRER